MLTCRLSAVCPACVPLCMPCLWSACVVWRGCSWDLSQPPRDNSPALRLYRHSQSVTGVAQITDERLVSGSMDGTVSVRVLAGR